MAVAWQFMGERPHIAGALNVILAAQRVDADARPPDVTGQHGEIGNADDGRGPLTMLRHTEAVIDGAVAAGRE